MSSTFTLPDGSSVSYDKPVSSATVAADISPSLAQAAVASSVNGELWDFHRTLPTEGTHQWRALTPKDTESLEILRHTAAHVLAEAVVRLCDYNVRINGPNCADKAVGAEIMASSVDDCNKARALVERIEAGVKQQL